MKSKLATLLIAVTLCLFADNLLAQGLYVSINAGAALKMSSSNLSGNINSTTNSVSTTQEQINVSLGQGKNFGGTLGYMFNENIGIELGVSYLSGDKSNALETLINGSNSSSFSSSMTRFNPTFIIASGMDKINPYAKFGFIIGSGDVIGSGKMTSGTDVINFEMKMNGGQAYGVNASLGALYNLNKKIALFAEITTINLSYAPSKGVLTVFTYNGTNQLQNMTTKNKEINFVDSYTAKKVDTTPDSQPSTELKQKYPFGSIGLNIGLKYAL